MAVQAVIAGRLRALLLVLLTAAGAASAQTQDKQPSTFGPVIGSALLCRDQLDNKYFYSWLSTHFGAPYKHEGGAFWFRTGEATLWGAPVTEVMVSDDTSELVFLAAVAANSSPYPLRISAPGGTIAYYNAKSKIYCAKFKPLPPQR
jgi:hypothetical protein